MALTFGQVTDILMLANGIPEERRATFVSRLKQWQKMGFPERVNVGRGVKVGYGASQLYQLALHMRLLALGLTPERAQRVIRAAWPRLVGSILETTLRRANGGQEYLYLLIQYDALTDLKDPGSSHEHIYVYPTYDWMIADAFAGVDDLEGDDLATFEAFQIGLRNAMVNALVLEIDSIVMRVWAAMTKLDLPASELSADFREWAEESLEKEKADEARPLPPMTYHDSLAGVQFCAGCFASELMGRKHEHGGDDGDPS